MQPPSQVGWQYHSPHLCAWGSPLAPASRQQRNYGSISAACHCLSPRCWPSRQSVHVWCCGSSCVWSGERGPSFTCQCAAQDRPGQRYFTHFASLVYWCKVILLVWHGITLNPFLCFQFFISHEWDSDPIELPNGNIDWGPVQPITFWSCFSAANVTNNIHLQMLLTTDEPTSSGDTIFGQWLHLQIFTSQGFNCAWSQ